MTYRLTPRATRAIERIDRWWSKNRPEAPNAVLDEIAEALEQIVNAPDSGSPWGSRKGVLLRRVLLSSTSNFLYYSLEDGVIVVHDVRGTPRARGPRFGGRLP